MTALLLLLLATAACGLLACSPMIYVLVDAIRAHERDIRERRDALAVRSEE